LVDIAFLREDLRALVVDPRVRKQLHSLVKAGYHITVLLWDRDKSTQLQQYGLKHYKNIGMKLISLKAPHGKPQLVFRFPIFWFWLLIELFLLRPKVIHAMRLDTALPAYFYKMLSRGTKFVFDLNERYAHAFIYSRSKFMFKIVNFIEEILTTKADLLLIASPLWFRSLKRFRTKETLVMMNLPPKKDYKNITLYEEKERERKSLKIYMAHITPEFFLVKKAISGLKNVKILITGFNKIGLKVLPPQIEYYGVLDHKNMIEIQSKADVFLILRNPHEVKSRLYSTIHRCNRFYEAMMLGKPVITNIKDEYALKKMPFCLLIDYDAESLREAILNLLKNPSIIHNLSAIALSLANSGEYCWENIEKKFLQKYKLLFKEK